MSTKTFQLTRETALAGRRWYVVDAEGVPVGRVATRVANLLRGKGKATFTPSVDCGDFVVVVNAQKVRLTGAKEEGKIYYRHTGYPGGIRTETAARLRERRPERILERAVHGMLPKSRLGRALATKLKVYPGPDHPHQAQKPEPIAMGG